MSISSQERWVSATLRLTAAIKAVREMPSVVLECPEMDEFTAAITEFEEASHALHSPLSLHV